MLSAGSGCCCCLGLCLRLTCSGKGDSCGKQPFQGPQGPLILNGLCYSSAQPPSGLTAPPPPYTHTHYMLQLVPPPSSMSEPGTKTLESSQPQDDLFKGSSAKLLWNQPEMGLGWKLGPKMLDLCRLSGCNSSPPDCGVSDFAGSCSNILTGCVACVSLGVFRFLPQPCGPCENSLGLEWLCR